MDSVAPYVAPGRDGEFSDLNPHNYELQRTRMNDIYINKILEHNQNCR